MVAAFLPSFFLSCGMQPGEIKGASLQRGSSAALQLPPLEMLAERGGALRWGILQKGDLMHSQRWDAQWAALAACSPSTRRVGSAGWRNKGTFSTFFLSFISQAETDSIRCKTKCQEKDVCYTEWYCCRKPACLSLAAFCSASSTDKVIQRF